MRCFILALVLMTFSISSYSFALDGSQPRQPSYTFADECEDVLDDMRSRNARRLFRQIMNFNPNSNNVMNFTDVTLAELDDVIWGVTHCRMFEDEGTREWNFLTAVLTTANNVRAILIRSGSGVPLRDSTNTRR